MFVKRVHPTRKRSAKRNTTLMSWALRPTLVAVTALLFVITVTSGQLLAAPTPRPNPQTAQTNRPHGDKVNSQQSEYDISLLEIPAVVHAGDKLSISVAIKAPDSPTDLEVAYIFGSSLSSRADLIQATKGANTSTLQLLTAPLTNAPSGSSTTSDHPFLAQIGPVVAESGTSDNNRISLRRNGVYPVNIQLRHAGRTDALATLTTFAIKLSTNVDEPLRFTWLWPVYSPPPRAPMGPDTSLRADLSQDQQSQGRLATLARVASTTPSPISLLVVPDTFSRVRKLSQNDPAASTVANSLVTTSRTHPVYSGSYSHVDSDAWSAIATEADRQFAGAEEVMKTEFGTFDTKIQVAPGPYVATSALQTMEAHGAQAVVVEPSAVTVPRGSFSVNQPFHVDKLNDMRILRADPNLPNDLTAAGGPTASSQQLLADLTMIYLDEPSQIRGTVLMPPWDWSAPESTLSASLSRLANAPHVRLLSAENLLNEVPDARSSQGKLRTLPLTRPNAVPTSAAMAMYNQSIQASSQLSQLEQLVADPDGPAHRELADLNTTVLESVDSTLITDGTSAAYSRHVTDATTAKFKSIQLPNQRELTLTSRHATLPVSIHNNSGLSLRLKVTLSSPGITFPNGNETILTVSSQSATTEFAIDTPSTGTYPIKIRVTSPDDQILLTQGRVLVQSTAANGVAIALTVGSISFLGVWWIVHARRRRKLKKSPTYSSGPPPSLRAQRSNLVRDSYLTNLESGTRLTPVIPKDRNDAETP